MEFNNHRIIAMAPIHNMIMLYNKRLFIMKIYM